MQDRMTNRGAKSDRKSVLSANSELRWTGARTRHELGLRARHELGLRTKQELGLSMDSCRRKRHISKNNKQVQTPGLGMYPEFRSAHCRGKGL